MTRTIDNSQDIMDSRDVIKYIGGLRSDIEIQFCNEDSDEDDPLFDELVPSANWFADEAQTAAFIAKCEAVGCVGEAEELAPLLAFADEAQCSDWSYGETLIRESYFEDYAHETGRGHRSNQVGRRLAEQFH